MTYHRVLTLFHHYWLSLYDLFTCRKTLVSVGDILMNRDEAIFVQFSTLSRILDIQSYVEQGDKRFVVQDTLAKYKYGERYGKDYNHNLMSKHFSSLIDSFRNNGYNEKSIVELDKEGTLTDGTHRVAMAVYCHQWELNAKIVRRKSKYPHNIDYFYKLGIDTCLIEEIVRQGNVVEEKFIMNGVSLGCLIYDVQPSIINSILNDLKALCDVKRLKPFILPKGATTSFEPTIKTTIEGNYILFILRNPKYDYKNKELISTRSKEIETTLNNRYEGKSKILFMNNCRKGKEMFNELQSYFI